MNKAIFLDRDGTIIEEVNYLKHTDDIKVIDGAFDSLRKFKELGFLNIVITNQSAVARGYLTIEELEKINERIIETINNNSGLTLIDKIYYCPFHPDGTIPQYSISNPCRKPDIGMINKAEEDFDINLKESFFIGDSYTDMKCAENAGVAKILVMTGYGKIAYNKCIEDNIEIDFFAKNIFHAAEYIVNKTLNEKQD